MIYDHSLVHGWRDRVGKEELAARDTLRKFMVQRTNTKSKVTGLPETGNDLKYNVSSLTGISATSHFLPRIAMGLGPMGVITVRQGSCR